MRVGSDGVLGGDPGAGIGAAVRVAAHLRVVADGLHAAASLYPAWSMVTWNGLAALDAQRLVAGQPSRFGAAAQAFRAAAEAVSAHAARLRVAAAAYEAAGRAPVAAAPALRHRAEQLAVSSAQELSSRLEALASTAPAKPSPLARVATTLQDWHDEVAVGAGESAAATIGVVARAAGMLRGVFSSRTPAEVRRARATLTTLATHPGPTAKALADWDTWAHNPPRALGHLVPDLIGGGGGARAAQVAAEAEHVSVIVASRSAWRAGRDGPTAQAAARALRERALAAPPARRDWHGPGGLRLPAVEVGRVRRFRALSVAGERAITADLRRIARASEGRLEGLRARRKTRASLYRKVAGGEPLEKINDVVRYTVVAGDEGYAEAVGRVTSKLWQAGYHPAVTKNFWLRDKPYRGINTTWITREGVTFEVQFHTPASRWATVVTHEAYEQMRIPEVQLEFAKVLEPPQAGFWTADTLPPDLPWLPPPRPPAHTPTWALTATTTPALATASSTTDPAN